MNFKAEYLINRYGQNMVSYNEVLSFFNHLDQDEQNAFFYLLLNLIVQSECTQEDVPLAIEENNLKPTYTPCVLLMKSVKIFNLKKIINLPDSEHQKVLLLLLGLFKQGYKRRFEQERNSPTKWWYWDFREPDKIKALKDLFLHDFF